MDICSPRSLHNFFDLQPFSHYIYVLLFQNTMLFPAKYNQKRPDRLFIRGFNNFLSVLLVNKIGSTASIAFSTIIQFRNSFQWHTTLFVDWLFSRKFMKYRIFQKIQITRKERKRNVLEEKRLHFLKMSDIDNEDRTKKGNNYHMKPYYFPLWLKLTRTTWLVSNMNLLWNIIPIDNSFFQS